MASPLREGVPTVEQFIAWDFRKIDAVFMACFLNTLMKEYGTMTPPKKDFKAFLVKNGLNNGDTNFQQLAYKRMGNRRYASMVRDFDGRSGLKTRYGDARGMIDIHMDTVAMEITCVTKTNDPHRSRRDAWDTKKLV